MVCHYLCHESLDLSTVAGDKFLVIWDEDLISSKVAEVSIVSDAAIYFLFSPYYLISLTT